MTPHQLVAALTSEDCFEIACFLSQRAKPNQSKVFFAQAIILDPKNADALAGMSSIYVHENDLAKAEESLNRSIASKPQCAMAWFNLGILKHRKQEFAPARSCFLISLTCNAPFVDLIYSALSMNSQYAGNYEQAIEEYKIALTHNPNNMAVKMSLGITQMLLGKWDEGLTNYEARVAVSPIPWPSQQIPMWNNNPRPLLDATI